MDIPNDSVNLETTGRYFLKTDFHYTQKPESRLLWVNAANGDVKNEGGIIIWKLQRNDVSFTHQK